MFTNLIFLILILLLVSFSIEMGPLSWPLEPWPAFGYGMALYALLLGLIVVQSRFLKGRSRETLLILVNFECLLFFIIFHYFLGAHRLLAFGQFQSGITLFSLALYLAALWLFHRTFDRIRLLIPFALPFLLFTLIFDLLLLLPADNFLVQMYHEGNFFLAFIPLLLVMGVMLLFLPPLIMRLWKCVPLEDSSLKKSLEELCEKAHFAHGGFKTWGVMDSSLTAAIVGVLPRLRYILFTKKLINDLSPSAVEAILAHEIGHSYRKHLLFYPLIFLGMALAMSLFSLCCLEGLAGLVYEGSKLIGVSWDLLFPLAAFISFSLILWLYFRYIYGFFSRLFERQADLHVFALGVPPEAMIEALDHVGVGTGFTHLVPNWHHFSLQERIDFLKEAMHNPQLISQHHRRVKRALFFYLMLLILGVGLLIYMGV
jgi:Zn-dependent protease with chaperone function